MSSEQIQGFFNLMDPWTELCRITIDGDDTDWTFRFGIEGSKIGLFTVNVPKSETEELNLLGVFELALARLHEKHKTLTEAGDLYDPKEIEP